MDCCILHLSVDLGLSISRPTALIVELRSLQEQDRMECQLEWARRNCRFPFEGQLPNLIDTCEVVPRQHGYDCMSHLCSCSRDRIQDEVC
jgi:hypothetical protein